jgi:hypothetical protein
MTLWSEFLTNKQRAIHKWTHYFPAYEMHFKRFVDRPCLFLEIGCGKGGSLQMWKRYLGPRARILGIDINGYCKEYEEDQISVRIGSQSNTDFLGSVLEEFGQPDVVLDDGSHQMSDVVTTFNYLYPRTSASGVYAVEDLHTAYWPEYGGGLRNPASFLELCKHLVDELNASWTRNELPPTQFTGSTLSMHFYDSLVFFERGRFMPRSAPEIGG